MIDWPLTLATYGYNKPGYRKRLCVVCDDCSAPGSLLLTRVADVINDQLPWRCKICVSKDISTSCKLVCNTPEFKAAVAARSKALWEDPEYRQKQAEKPPNDPVVMSQAMAKLWEDPEYRKRRAEAMSRPEVKEKISTNAKRSWADPVYRMHMIGVLQKRAQRLWKDPEYRQTIINRLKDHPSLIAAGKQRWADPIYRAEYTEFLKSLWNDLAYREKMSKLAQTRMLARSELTSRRMKQLWQDPIYRARLIPQLRTIMERKWQDPSFREMILQSINTPEVKQRLALVRAQMPRVSSIQTQLYSILDDLGVVYYREWPDGPADPQCLIGPYSFDCVIPREHKPTLLIECQGDYWHSLEKVSRRDQGKQSYISKFREYELKCLWEHEFLQKDRIKETLLYWLGCNKSQLVDFDYDEIVIKVASAVDYRLLLGKYHYLATAPLGSHAFGAYYQGTLVAVAIFSSVRRQNLEASIGFPADQIRELSRFCVHPNYQQPNLGSWFLSRCLKRLPEQYKCIVSYCDTTFNHDGALYKACNFVLDKEVPSDYWYTSIDGWVMHKKTLYNHAVRCHTTESEFAESRGYKKVFGDKKLRFKYVRR